MANIITLTRLLLLLPLVAMIYLASPSWQLATVPLLAVIIGMDGLDGYVARKRREVSVFGSIFDIAVDRVIEYMLWAVLAHVGLVPMWVALVFIIRGTLVDSIRYAAIAEGETAFGMMRSPIGRFLVASRFMRGMYGTIKATAFGWLLLIQPLPDLAPAFWGDWSGPVGMITIILVYASVVVCLVRGVPVIVEFAVQHKVFSPDQAAREAH
ncbi:MAG: CDP-alcohol phosphatidyltransferase family protein [Kiloniellales bacterium]|jgi:CDP-diacylglycerol--glycerol-3-phosphate 3-phosphatidyltransferase